VLLLTTSGYSQNQKTDEEEMAKRNFPDWIEAYTAYASFSEAPKRMHFWTAVSVVAGALRRKVWIDQTYFKWHCNFYVILVAPPGIVSKSTTAGIGMNLLRKVPGIKFGPDVITWQALVGAFADSKEEFQLGDLYYPMCALTIESSEFGNLFNPQDKDMVDLFVTLWDGKQGAFTKVTKMSGSDTVENPWINIIACTTPAWIAGNFPDYLIGGGFTSRCVFVYADAKEKYVAYPGLAVPQNLARIEAGLVEDLERIATTIAGPYVLRPDAVAWGEKWYRHHYENRPAHLDDERFGGYIARKQTHIHKLAMVLAASQRDDLYITEEDLATANVMVSDLETDMAQVFSRIGRTEASIQAERFIGFIRKRRVVPYEEAYKFIYASFPDAKDFEGILNGALRSGQIRLTQTTSGFMICVPEAVQAPVVAPVDVISTPVIDANAAANG
jgi:hypothetical protein